jgi:hypothetical protein
MRSTEAPSLQSRVPVHNLIPNFFIATCLNSSVSDTISSASSVGTSTPQFHLLGHPYALCIPRGHTRVRDGSDNPFNITGHSGPLGINPSHARLPARFSSDRTSLLGLTAPRASARTSSHNPIHNSSRLRHHWTARCQRDHTCGVLDMHSGVSLISVEQVQKIDKGIGIITLEQSARTTCSAWEETRCRYRVT